MASSDDNESLVMFVVISTYFIKY